MEVSQTKTSPTTKKVCKTTVVPCYHCFSLLSMLWLAFIASIAGKSKVVEEQKGYSGLANCGGPQ